MKEAITFRSFLKWECVWETYDGLPLQHTVKTTIGKYLDFRKAIACWLQHKYKDATVDDFINEAIVFPSKELTYPINLDNYRFYYLELDGKFREHKFTISLFCDEGVEIFYK